MKTTLGRRTFLRGVLAGGAAVSVGTPLLDIMVDGNGTALADDSPLPMRFGTFYWGCGILHEAWLPSATGFGFTPSDSIAPFTELAPALAPYVTVVSGTNHRDAAPGHIPARGVTLSSSHDTTWVDADVGAGYRRQEMPEPSVDVLVREAWAGRATQRDSVHLSITDARPYHGNISWSRGGRAFNPPESTPQALYDALFSGIAAAPPTSGGRAPALLRLTTALERSMLDAVRQDTEALRGRLGATDRLRLDDHLEGLRAVERRLQDYQRTLDDPGAEPMTCAAVAPGSASAVLDKSRLMSELLAIALACDLTRVFTYEWSSNQSEFVYSDLGIDGTHHDDISHHLTARADDMRRIVRLVTTGYAHLAEALRSRTELDGNVLDRTLILGTSEHANANRHDYRDHPFLLVGKAGGALRAGQHFRHPSPGDNFAAPDVLLTAVRAVGVELEGLGMSAATDSRGAALPDRRSTAPIAALLA